MTLPEEYGVPNATSCGSSVAAGIRCISTNTTSICAANEISSAVFHVLREVGFSSENIEIPLLAFGRSPEPTPDHQQISSRPTRLPQAVDVKFAIPAKTTCRATKLFQQF